MSSERMRLHISSRRNKLDYKAKIQRNEVREWDEKQATIKRKKKIMGIEVAALKLAKSDPVVRSTEYLDYLRNGGFPVRTDIDDGAHIYVIRLEEPAEKYLDKHTFPNAEYPPIVGMEDNGFKGHVYVGHTQRKLTKEQSEAAEGDPVLHRFKYEHKEGKNLQRSLNSTARLMISNLWS